MASSSDSLCNTEKKKECDRLRIARKRANPVYRDKERAGDRQRMATNVNGCNISYDEAN